MRYLSWCWAIALIVLLAGGVVPSEAQEESEDGASISEPASADINPATEDADGPPLALTLRDTRVNYVLDRISLAAEERHVGRGFVKDLGVSIFVHEVNPAKMRASLKNLLYLSWRKEERADKTILTLYQDTKSQAKQEQLLAAQLGKKSPPYIVGEFLRKCEEAEHLDKEGRELLKKSDPYTYAMITTPLRCAQRALVAALGPASFGPMDAEKRYAIPYSALSPSAQQTFRACVLANDAHRRSTEPNYSPLPPDLDWSHSKLEIELLNPRRTPAEEARVGLSVVYTEEGPGAMASLGFPIFSTPSPTMRTVCATEILEFELPAGYSREQWLKQLPEVYKREEKLTQEMEKASRQQQRVIPDELNQEIELKFELKEKVISVQSKSGTQEIRRTVEPKPSEVLAAIAKESGIDIYSDSFPDENGIFPTRVSGKWPVWEALDVLAAVCNGEWEYKNGVILMRDTQWYWKRNWIIPEATIVKWRKVLMTRNTLGKSGETNDKCFTFDDLCTMTVELSDEQIIHGLNPYEDLRKATGDELDAKQGGLWYRVLGVLTKEQRALLEGPGLPVVTLSTKQVEVWRQAWSSEGVSADALPWLMMTEVSYGEGSNVPRLCLIDEEGREVANKSLGRPRQ